MLKSCSRCGNLHPFGYVCTKGKVYRRGEESKLRTKYAWEKKSLEIRERANWLCEVCRDHGIYTYHNLEVHHIEKIKDAPDLLLDNNNLICLCVPCHRQADKGKLTKSYLYELVALREREC